MKSYGKMTLEKFLGELGSASAVPGGGAAAAVVGAAGAALLEMVVRIKNKRALKKLDSNSLDPEASQKISTIISMKKKFLRLANEDAKAFEKSWALHKAKIRDKSYEKAIQKSTSIPIEISDLAGQLLGMAVLEKEHISKWLVSDLKEAAILLEASYRSAQLNVEINFKMSTDFSNRTFIESMKKKLSAINQTVAHCYHQLMEF